MFRLYPPMPVGGPERPFPRPNPAWAVVAILVIVSQWQAEQAAILLAVLATIAVLSLALAWAPRHA
jgi:hypothetical protein